MRTAGDTYDSVITNASRRRSPVHAFRVAYRRLHEAEFVRWSTYLGARVSARGWDAAKLIAGLRRLSRSTPQIHRWFLLKVHLNAPLTARRVAVAGVPVQVLHCQFCVSGEDALSHIARCPAAMAAYEGVASLTSLSLSANALPALML